MWSSALLPVHLGWPENTLTNKLKQKWHASNSGIAFKKLVASTLSFGLCNDFIKVKLRCLKDRMGGPETSQSRKKDIFSSLSCTGGIQVHRPVKIHRNEHLK